MASDFSASRRKFLKQSAFAAAYLVVPLALARPTQARPTQSTATTRDSTTLRAEIKSILPVIANPPKTDAYRTQQALLWALDDADLLKAKNLTDALSTAQFGMTFTDILTDVDSKIVRNANGVATALDTSVGQAQAVTPALQPLFDSLFATIPHTQTSDPNYNPYYADTLNTMTNLRKSTITYAKPPSQVPTDPGYVPDPSIPANLTDFNKWILNCPLMANALCHPSVSLAGDPALIAPMLRRFAAAYDSLMPLSIGKLADFGWSAVVTEMYLLVSTVYPNLILMHHKMAWEAFIQKNADQIYSNHKDTYAAGKVADAYPNSDVRMITALVYANLLFNTSPAAPNYLTTASNGINLVQKVLYPDGGFGYIGFQNETFSYHSVNVTEMARLSQFGKFGSANQSIAQNFSLTQMSQTALGLVTGSRWYCPLSIEAPGVAEYSTAISWHHYWNQNTCSDVAEVVVGALASQLATMATSDSRYSDYMNSVQQNRRLEQLVPPSGTVLLASFYRPEVLAAVPNDGYFVYDQNIQGPRGRFGNFSFSGTARLFRASDGTQEDNRGKSTFVGCMTTYPSAEQVPADQGSTTWLLSAALQDATTEVFVKSFSPAEVASRITPTDNNAMFTSPTASDLIFTGQDPQHSIVIAPDVDASHNALRPLASYSQSQRETNAVTVAADIAALTTQYQVASYKTDPINWQGQQQWIYTPERMIGLVAVNAMTDTTAYGVNGALELVSGRDIWGSRKTFLASGSVGSSSAPNSFEYGDLEVRIVDQNYNSDPSNIRLQYTDVFDHYDSRPGLAARLLIPDRDIKNVGLKSYPKGTMFYYLVEIRPKWSAASTYVFRQTFTNPLSSGLLGFEVRERGDATLPNPYQARRYRVIHNPTIQSVTYNEIVNWGVSKIWLHQSGEKYRPKWINSDNNPGWIDANGNLTHTNPAQVYTLMGGKTNISIPPGQHIILMVDTQKPPA